MQVVLVLVPATAPPLYCGLCDVVFDEAPNRRLALSNFNKHTALHCLEAGCVPAKSGKFTARINMSDKELTKLKLDPLDASYTCDGEEWNSLRPEFAHCFTGFERVRYPSGCTHIKFPCSNCSGQFLWKGNRNQNVRTVIKRRIAKGFADSVCTSTLLHHVQINGTPPSQLTRTAFKVGASLWTADKKNAWDTLLRLLNSLLLPRLDIISTVDVMDRLKAIDTVGQRDMNM